jgi:hypothetical protein
VYPIKSALELAQELRALDVQRYQQAALIAY